MSELGPPPRRKQLHPMAMVGIGCAIVFFGGVAFVIFILIAVFGSLRASTPFKESLARARNDPRVIAVLGSPIESSIVFSGSVNVTNDTGDANLQIPLTGPKGKGTLRVVARKANGVWIYTEMAVSPENGAPINLLASPPRSSGTAPPGG